MVKDMGVPFTWLGFYSENLPYQIGHALLAYTILHLFGGRELGEHISRCALVPKRNSPLSAR